MPEDPVEQERFQRRLMATASSLKKKQQQLRADQDLLFLKAVRRGHKPAFKTLLFDGILRHDEFVIVEAAPSEGGM